MSPIVAEFAHALGLVPLLWLAWLHGRGQRRDRAWWLIAAGLGVSFLADFFPHALAQQVYPVSQAALVALALLGPSAGFVAYVAVLLASAAASITWREAVGYDVLLRVVAFGGVSVLAWWTMVPSLLRPDRLRMALGFGFAAQLAAWAWFTGDPTFVSWGALQLARLGTTVGFCVAASRA